MCGFIYGLSIMFHWSVFLLLCQYHIVLMTVPLWYSLKPGRLIPPAPFFFLKTSLAIQGLLCFHMNYEIFCSWASHLAHSFIYFSRVYYYICNTEREPIKCQAHVTGSKALTCALGSVAQACPTLWPHGQKSTRLPCPLDSPGRNTAVGCHALLQGNEETQQRVMPLRSCQSRGRQVSPRRVRGHCARYSQKAEKRGLLCRDF